MAADDKKPSGKKVAKCKEQFKKDKSAYRHTGT